MWLPVPTSHQSKTISLYDTEKLFPEKHLVKFGMLKAPDASFTHKAVARELPTMTIAPPSLLSSLKRLYVVFL